MRFQVLGSVIAAAITLAGCGSNSGVSSESGESSAMTGNVVVVSTPIPGSSVFTNVVAADFFDGPVHTAATGCKREVIATCTVRHCDLTNPGMWTGEPVQSAGTITIGGTTPPFTLSYDETTKWYNPSPAVQMGPPLFADGSTITFAASGSHIPKFADSLVAPSRLTITSPPLPNAISIDTSKDFEFQWTGDSVGRVTFDISTTTKSDGADVASSSVSCYFDASALKGTIPATILQKLRKTDAATTAGLGSDLSNVKNVAAGDYVVHLSIRSAIYQMGEHSGYGGQITVF